MSSLISLVVVDQEPRVDSRLIAEQLGVKNINTRELVDQYQSDFEEFGQLPFQTEVGKRHQGGGNPEKFYLLNEDQSYLLLAYSKNTDQARDLKKRLVRSFGEHRRALTVSIPTIALPVTESSLVLDYLGIPIRFLIDASGQWQATYKDVATALGYAGDAYTAAHLLLKNSIRPRDRQLKHPLYGDLISLSGLETTFVQLERSRPYSLERADAALQFRDWLARVAAPLVAQPASVGRLLSQNWTPPAGQLALAYDPDYQQTAQVLMLWHKVLGESPYRAADALALATGELAEALMEVARSRWFSTLFSAKRLGKWLSLRQGQPVDGLRITSVSDRGRKVRLWSVQQVSA